MLDQIVHVNFEDTNHCHSKQTTYLRRTAELCYLPHVHGADNRHPV